MMNDERTIEELEQEFHEYSHGLAVLRNIRGIALTIECLENEIEQQREEMEDVFDCAVDHIRFRRILRPIVRNYRERSAHPYRRPSPPRPSSSNSAPNEPPVTPPSNESTSPTALSDSPRTVAILSPTNSDEEPSSYGTAPESEPGTAENPIVVDRKSVV